MSPWKFTASDFELNYSTFLFQGLANLYEKTDQWDFKTELPDVYQKLIELCARYATEGPL